MTIELDIGERRADLRLNRPEVLNAMNLDMFDDLAKAVDEIAGAPDVRVVVVAGNGRSFSSGIDTSSFASGGSFEDLIRRAQAGYRKLATLEVPTVAKVHGHALGAGLQVALACDIRVMAEDADLGLLEHRFGIIPDLGGTHRLPQIVGAGMAKKMIWTRERISGTEAARRGLAEVVASRDDLDATVDGLADAIAEAPPVAVREVKRLIGASPPRDTDEAFDREMDAQLKAFASKDFNEAIAAFLEKRAPRYEGR